MAFSTRILANLGILLNVILFGIAKDSSDRLGSLRLLGGGSSSVKKGDYGMSYCKKKSPNLDKHNQTVCLECSKGFRTRSQGYGCSKCKAPCLECSGLDTFCTACDKGTTLDYQKGKCLKCSYGCAKCDIKETSAGECKVCKVGFFKTDKKRCHPCPEFCDVCKNSFTCEKCHENYLLRTYKTGRQICYIAFQQKLINMVASLGFVGSAFLFACLCFFSISQSKKERMGQSLPEADSDPELSSISKLERPAKKGESKYLDSEGTEPKEPKKSSKSSEDKKDKDEKETEPNPGLNRVQQMVAEMEENQGPSTQAAVGSPKETAQK